MRSWFVPLLAVGALLLALAMAKEDPGFTETHRTIMDTRAAKQLNIYIFNVGQGMSQLIVFPSGYSILIDACELSASSDKTAQMVAQRIHDILGSGNVDVGIISHYHMDHMGMVGYGGMWGLIETYGIKFGKFLERDAGIWVDANNDGKCDMTKEIVWHNVGTLSSTAQTWVCYATDSRNKKIYPVREIASLCDNAQIDPPDPGATVTIVAVDAYGAVMVDGKTPVPGDHSNDNVPPSENDFSVGVVVKYGAFTYASFGDLDGEYSTSSFGYTYNDIESTVAKRVGEVDVYHVNHHGSSHSSSQNFLNVLKPATALISCGYDNSYGHPAQDTVDRLNGVGAHLFLTNDGNPGMDYGKNSIVANSEIVLSIPGGGKGYTVSAGGSNYTFVSKGVKSPSCTK